MKHLLSLLIVSLAGAGALSAKPGDLTDAQQAQLAKDKIIITDQTWRQVFSPYIFAGQPVFITSDSALNAFHVLLEESVAQMEAQQAARLPAVLEAVLAEVGEAPDGMSAEAFAAAARRVRLVLGTAARLAGSNWSGGPEVDALIAEEAKKVEAAAGLALPGWMQSGHGLEALDYRVFKPAGFYTRNETMQRYFRALRWLQSVPFRLRDPREMDAATVLGTAIWKEGSLPELAARLLSLSGEAAHPAAAAMDDFRWNPGDAINRLPEEQTGESAFLTAFPAAALPDARLMERTTSRDRPFPDPLEIGAWLGSPLAGRLLKDAAGGEVLKIIERAQEKNPRDTIYERYFRALKPLLAPPEPGAPPFMGTEAWERKSLNTVLSGWVQLRHTWALLAKEDAMWLPAGLPYPGFVEPCPAFFHGLSQLILRCVEEFDGMGALSPSPELFAADAAAVLPLMEKEAAEIRKRMEPWMKRKAKWEDLTDEERDQLIKDATPSEKLCAALTPVAGCVDGVSLGFPGAVVSGINDVDALLASLREAAAGRRAAAFLKFHREHYIPSLRSRWMRLLSVTQKLESRAHRQLRGLEPSDEEARFIVDYGETLGGIMFYDGNSYHIPRDDAPRAASVFHRAGGEFLIAGTGRPREIRVLYPWQGKEVLCRGAVLPFHTAMSPAHVTDSEWRARLDSPKPPAAEAWLRPVLSPDAPAKHGEE